MSTHTESVDPPEVWAGLECTVNRVGDRYFDQFALTGHDRRGVADLDRIAALGVKAVRYPVLWERHQPTGGAAAWVLTAERLGRLRVHGVRPIVGLAHHGSGPPHTSLADPGFPGGLAAHAAEVARRFPWADAYTPVNEPLTTARFSGLYGHWYPHGRDARTFATALLTQCKATVLAMAAVRRVRADAVLVQTEDVGQTHAPPHLAYQAEWENHRRWLTFDLLCGRVDRGHPLWGYLAWVGVPERDVLWFRDHPCPPDVLGVNHHLTSERYLDDRLDRYPPDLIGGNHRHRYVDVEAVRAVPGGCAGPASILRQTWDRYRRPVAVTEAHLGCTRDEQVRWLAEVWRAACDLRRDGCDVRAVTAWAAFGSCDWDSLVTLGRGHYEPGVFDARCAPPRPTALAGAVREMSAGRAPAHPVTDAPGWWLRPDRLLFADDRAAAAPAPAPVGRPRPVLITGAAGALGRSFARICRRRGLPYVPLPRADLDVADPAAVAAAIERHRPWAVVNAAGCERMDAAEADPSHCLRANALGPAVLAAACAARGVGLVTFSSGHVFDGRAGRAYREADPTAPVGVYGLAKAAGEQDALARHPHALVVRTGPVFGPWDRANFVARAVAAARAGQSFAAADDVTVSPAYAPDLADAVLDLLIDGESGVWHLSASTPLTWAELAREAAARAGCDPGVVVGRPASALGWAAPRPPFAALATDRGPPLPPAADGLARFLREFDPAPAA